jgi:hypothetical protein
MARTSLDPGPTVMVWSSPEMMTATVPLLPSSISLAVHCSPGVRLPYVTVAGVV